MISCWLNCVNNIYEISHQVLLFWSRNGILLIYVLKTGGVQVLSSSQAYALNVPLLSPWQCHAISTVLISPHWKSKLRNAWGQYKRNNRSCLNFTWTMCSCFEHSCHAHLSAAAGASMLGPYHAEVSPIGVELRRL